MSDRATLTYKGKTIDLPALNPTEGTTVLDIRSLYKELDVFTYDPGFTSTASCHSKITFINGDVGRLLYRGYDIADLAKNCDFMEVCYLLLKGELPTGIERKDFIAELNKHSMVHDQMHNFFKGFRRDAHPMAILIGVVGLCILKIH
jgi:citrate synthase